MSVDRMQTLNVIRMNTYSGELMAVCPDCDRHVACRIEGYAVDGTPMIRFVYHTKDGKRCDNPRSYYMRTAFGE